MSADLAQATTDPKIQKAAEEVVFACIEEGKVDKGRLIKIKNNICRDYHLNSFSDAELMLAYERLLANQKIEANYQIKKLFLSKKVRTQSGVAPISVLTKPFPCRGKCVYCPTEVMSGGKTFMHEGLEKKGQKIEMADHYKDGDLVMPKSYISSEPGASRALMADFDPYLQISRRIKSLDRLGHSSDKCELIVQGGTFSDLPVSYRRKFITRCYRAFNDPYNPPADLAEQDIDIAKKNYKTDSKKWDDDLEEQIKINETADHRIIGLTVETRPDALPPSEIQFFRQLGVTRVEMGVQTLDEEVNEITKRGHDVNDVIAATNKLRAAGFKIVYHMMPMLPGSTAEIDLRDYKRLWSDANFRPDYIKVYPTSVTPMSELHEWWESGKYVPYTEEELFEVLTKILLASPPYVRISRFVRDIPSTAIVAGSRMTNTRQVLEDRLTAAGESSQDVRAREVKSDDFDFTKAQLKIREHDANLGHEYFLEYQIQSSPPLKGDIGGSKNSELKTTPPTPLHRGAPVEETLLALLRLRIPQSDEFLHCEEIKGCAVIRELHTYGVAKGIKNENPIILPCEGGLGGLKSDKAQHLGFGKRLVAKAEELAKENGFDKIAVISGVGVKDYYRKLGYKDAGTYLVKEL